MSASLTRTQRKVLRYLRDNPEAFINAALNPGRDYERTGVMFYKGQNWVQHAGQCVMPLANKTLEALCPRYVHQRFEMSGDIRHFYLTDAGREAA